MRARLRGERLAAPDLAKVEAASVIRRHLASGAVDREQAGAAIEDLIELPVLLFPIASDAPPGCMVATVVCWPAIAGR